MPATIEEVEEMQEDKIIDYFETTEEEIDAFETQAWNKGEGFKIPGYPVIEDRLEGQDSGLYIFAGESNSGKSAVMMNLLDDICSCEENNLFGLYFSLDDSSHEIIPRIIAKNKEIPIGVVSKPGRYQTMIDKGLENASVYKRWLDKREEGIEELKEKKDKLKIIDGRTIKSAEDLLAYLENVQTYLKAVAPGKRMIVAIDSLNDIRFESIKYKPGNELNSAIAREVKQWSVDLDIPIYGSAHLRKLNGNRRPSLDDLKESSEYIYEASLVWLVHNDVSKNKQAANIYYNEEGSDEKKPVLELNWAKNKKSSFKGHTYCYFRAEMSKLVECDKSAMERYDALVYEQ